MPLQCSNLASRKCRERSNSFFCKNLKIVSSIWFPWNVIGKYYFKKSCSKYSQIVNQNAKLPAVIRYVQEVNYCLTVKTSSLGGSAIIMASWLIFILFWFPAMEFLAFFEEIFSNMDDCHFVLICSHNPPQTRAKGWKLGEIWPFLVNLRRNLEYVLYFLILHFTSLSTCGFLLAQWWRKSVVSICESKNKQWPL